jgi:hypothetical protein
LAVGWETTSAARNRCDSRADRESIDAIAKPMM